MEHQLSKSNNSNRMFYGILEKANNLFEFCDKNTLISGLFSFTTGAYAWVLSFLNPYVTTTLEEVLHLVNKIGGTIGMILGVIVGVYTILIKIQRLKNVKDKNKDEEDK